jgi:hypothetical protein
MALHIFDLKSEYIRRVTPDPDKKSKHKLYTNPLHFDRDIQRYEAQFETRKATYLEQETKERFLRAIINDPPFFVEEWDMKDVEQSTRTKKHHLKEEKTKSRQLLAELDVRTRQICQDYETGEDLENQAVHLDEEILQMEQELAALESQYQQLSLPVHFDRELNGSIQELIDLEAKYSVQVSQLRGDLADIDSALREVEEVQTQLETEVDQLKVQNETTRASTEQIVRLRQEEFKTGQIHKEITASFYRNMVACLLEIVEVTDFVVEPPDQDDVQRVRFQSNNVKFDLRVSSVQGLLDGSTVSGLNNEIMKHAFDYAKRSPIRSQLELFVSLCMDGGLGGHHIN